MNRTVSEITGEQLIENGWSKIEDGDEGFPVFIFQKKLENNNPINSDPDDTGIMLVVHRMFNTPMIAVYMPNGAMLNMDFETIDDLNRFENQILFYDCEY